METAGPVPDVKQVKPLSVHLCSSGRKISIASQAIKKERRNFRLTGSKIISHIFLGRAIGGHVFGKEKKRNNKLNIYFGKDK